MGGTSVAEGEVGAGEVAASPVSLSQPQGQDTQAESIGLSPEQQAMRMSGIGASEMASIVGLNPWSSAHDVWALKVGLIEPFQGNAHTARGTYLEPSIRRWYADEAGVTVTLPGTLRHPEIPYILATPDGITDHEDGPRILEIKAPSFRTAHHWGEPGTDEIPDYYIPQVTQQMAVTGCRKADVAALIGGALQVYTVEFDIELWEYLEDAAATFWACVESREPPEVDASAGCSSYLAQRFASHSDEILPANGEVEDLAERLRAVREAKADLDTEEKGLINEIKAHIGAAAGVSGPWGKITWKATKDRTVTDWKAVAKSVEPSVIAENTTTKPGSRVFRCSFKGE